MKTIDRWIAGTIAELEQRHPYGCDDATATEIGSDVAQRLRMKPPAIVKWDPRGRPPFWYAATPPS